ncbi:protein NUCLEOLAR COMPLEX ASSOCIATED 4 isoform X2 [Telopea speciosissima]|uniref:protein NUCLEOLAR COMPLEX ASSOCIATED 4 isoform X2 n=1 Tax=Telopea speciosissima TaxID=54955 RepID=UPI001CC4BF1B|nr:protein NUCLEOLAR COMPLEX ASSOCIATED 4 isoform X2 [Telopea speciosissima]
MASILAKIQKQREKYSLKELKTLGNQLLSSRAHINNLPLLLSFVSLSSSPRHALESIISLQSFFIPVLPELPSSSSPKSLLNVGEEEKDPELVYRIWLRSKFDEFVKSLITVAVSQESDEALREVALDAVMEFVKLGKGGRFQSAIYHRLLHTIVHSTSSMDFLLDLIVSKFVKYIDVCYFTYISVEKIAKSLEVTNIYNGNVVIQEDGKFISRESNIEISIHKIHYLLAHISPLHKQDGDHDRETWSESGFSSKDNELKGALQVKDRQTKSNKLKKDVSSLSNIAKRMKLKFTKAWLSFLRLPLPLDVYKEVLISLHQAVIPHMSNPVMLCDFLTRSYDIGGVISVMALSSLFILMTQYGLEYPNFYEKLYALLVPSTFMAKHRAKFFQLLDSCLKSPLLPAYLAAAFAKKLSRLSLSVPPSGTLVIIALIHNLLRRHPSINFLVHWQTDDDTNRDPSREGTEFGENAKESGVPEVPSRKPGIDLFNSEESDPAKCNAMRSSLWEIDTLRHHYCPPVSRFVASLENDLTVRAKTTEVAVKDFSSGSYATIFKAEIGRRMKQVPLAFYKSTPTSLFSESDFVGWTFNAKENERKGTEHDDENGAVDISKEDDLKPTKRQRIDCC